jgi:hypothetical protein
MGCSSFQTGKEGNMSEEAREACFSSQWGDQRGRVKWLSAMFINGVLASSFLILFIYFGWKEKEWNSEDGFFLLLVRYHNSCIMSWEV